MAERGLGTGLGALFGDAAIENLSNDFEYLPIAKVEPRKGQPRTRFDEDELFELAESIKEHGVIQPLTVRKVDGGYYQIIAGERRWRAARIAELTEIPVRIIEVDDGKAMEIALVENLQREDLNPVEEAYGYQALMTEYGLTQEETARRVGKSRPAIANVLRLLALPKELLDMLEKREISAGAAKPLLALTDEAQIIAAARTIVDKEMTARESEQMVKKILQTQEKKLKKDELIVDYMEEIERQLTATMGRRVKIANGKKKGRIEIEYYGREDFETLILALSEFTRKDK